ncbi:glycosyltransferase [Deinococcus sp. HMF7620]|uniref:Glycosyltransferase n=1 Tax=Deinococcus arboris TaxID=2682977 RepID=A0A7C9M9X8_9DEIO|nr:glycosyltransferase [Deinococcus arboris]MVN87979.1 glycosyltransferase [Deinococcus arboris]
MTQRPIKILFVGSVVPDTAMYRTSAFSRAGNLAQQGLLDGMADEGAELTVLGFQPVPAFPRGKQLWIQGSWLGGRHQQRLISFVNLPYAKQLSLAGGILTGTYALSRRSRPQVLMSYNVNTFVAAPLIVLSKVLRIPYIPVVYDVDVPGATVANGLFQRGEYWWAGRVLPKLAGAVVGTELISRELMPDRPTLVVEGGLNWQQQQYAPEVVASDDTFNIVFAGALEAYNGVDVMIDALAWLPANVRLHVAGQGRLQTAVQTAAARDSRILYHGLLDMDGLRQLYARSDVLVNHRSDKRLDSRYVFPSKLIEYLALGLPVVSTHFRSLPKDYLPFLHLIPDESPDALAKSIEQVMISNQEARLRAQNAQTFVHKQKAWSFQGQRILGFLRGFL